MSEERTGLLLIAVLAIDISMPAGTALAQSNPWDPVAVPVTVEVQAIAELEFPDGTENTDGTAKLHLYVPPPNSTIPSEGLPFIVRGNASAWVSAKPEEFILISPYYVGNVNFGPKYLGRAVHLDGDEIGYSLQVEFPIGTSSALPLTDGQGTPAVPVDMAANGGEVQGFLHLLASQRWTPNAVMPAVGDYHGDVVVTIGADPL